MRCVEDVACGQATSSTRLHLCRLRPARGCSSEGRNSTAPTQRPSLTTHGSLTKISGTEKGRSLPRIPTRTSPHSQRESCSNVAHQSFGVFPTEPSFLPPFFCPQCFCHPIRVNLRPFAVTLDRFAAPNVSVTPFASICVHLRLPFRRPPWPHSMPRPGLAAII